MQKEIKGLKVLESINWKTYRNENQGFELEIPHDETEGVFFEVRTGRVLSAASPPIFHFPFCHKHQRTILSDQIVSKELYSVYDSKLGDKTIECNSSIDESDESLLDKHSIETRLCLDNNLNFYPAKVGGALEPLYLCEKEGSIVYYFDLACEGEDWKGKEGRDRCDQLFDQILSTFRFIEE